MFGQGYGLFGWLWCLSCLLLFGVSKSSNDTNASFSCTSDWEVDFVGKSGQFKLFPCSNSNFFIKIKLERIQAYNSDGSAQNQNKQTSFAYASAVSGEGSITNSSVYNWKDEDGNDVTLNAVTLNYEFDISGTPVEFVMNVYLIDEDIVVEYSDGNDTYSETLDAGSVKFDFQITDWPFENDDDMLKISIKATTGGSSDDGDDDGSSNGASTYSWGDDFSMKMPEVYENIDSNGTSSSKETEITYDSTSSGSQTTVELLFVDAGDAKTILYDPWITGSNNSSDMKHISFALLFTTLFFMSYFF